MKDKLSVIIPIGLWVIFGGLLVLSLVIKNSYYMQWAIFGIIIIPIFELAYLLIKFAKTPDKINKIKKNINREEKIILLLLLISLILICFNTDFAILTFIIIGGIITIKKYFKKEEI